MEFEDVDIDILVGSIEAISKLVTYGHLSNGKGPPLSSMKLTLSSMIVSLTNCHFLKRFPFDMNHIQDDKVVGSQMIFASAKMPKDSDKLLQSIIDTSTLHQVFSPNLHRLIPHITH